ncbi:endonuclease/exonuclease/phosphatase family protein [Oceanobacillus kapialis]|uniref:Endonuclease/exonuclease/phosphatase family protein n=1 Tax=Oceanobacillus kapialis TaxID=481353 RepID=A0ABW5Q0R0_9BACI
MKNVILFIASFLLLLWVSLSPSPEMLAVQESNEMQTEELNVKVATYNVAAGRGTDGTYNLERIATAIEETDADIIGLQEVDVHWGARSEHDNMIAQLAEQLDMYYYFAPIYDFEPANEGDPRRQFGVAVLSKYPIIAAANREIARLSTQDPNPVPKPAPGFLEAHINVEGADVAFYVTHLDYRGDPTVREMQVADMKEIMAENTYSILVGDMNARPNATELQPLLQKYADVWKWSDDDEGYTYPAVAPDRRIDYVLTSPRIEVHTATTMTTEAADHIPVIAEVSLLQGSSSYNLAGTAWLVDHYTEYGEIQEERTSTILQQHLEVLAYYKKQGKDEKLVKHLQGMRVYLDHQKESGAISDKAWEELKRDVNYFIGKWDG